MKITNVTSEWTDPHQENVSTCTNVKACSDEIYRSVTMVTELPLSTMDKVENKKASGHQQFETGSENTILSELESKASRGDYDPAVVLSWTTNNDCENTDPKPTVVEDAIASTTEDNAEMQWISPLELQGVNGTEARFDVESPENNLSSESQQVLHLTAGQQILHLDIGAGQDQNGTQLLELPSGQVIELYQGQNLINLDENMNIVENCQEEPISVESMTDTPCSSDTAAFKCTLCGEGFVRKLYLNNHMERRHGVKFVFTERGRKVKLVRLPKDFEFRDGEKLDPCVQMLLKATETQNFQGVIGVQPVDNSQSVLSSQCRPRNTIDSQHDGTIKEEFGCGFLVTTIQTEAIEKSKKRRETPFAAFYPAEIEASFLLRIVAINDQQHLLIPAQQSDVVNAEGLISKPVLNQNPGSSTQMHTKISYDYKIPIVAVVKQVNDENLNQSVILVEPPGKKPIENISFLSLEQFADYAMQCQGKKLRTLEEATVSSMPQEGLVPLKPKKKYTRRSFRSKNSNVLTEDPQNKENKLNNKEISSSTSYHETPLLSAASLRRSRRCLHKQRSDYGDDGNGNKIVSSNEPSMNCNIPPKKKRGRPRKILVDDENQTNQEQVASKKWKGKPHVLPCVENIVKKEVESQREEMSLISY